MRRWNGWGDSSVNYPLPPGSDAFLQAALGEGDTSADAAMEASLGQVPASLIKPSSGISIDPVERLLHTHGQSLPDWIALRYGQIGRTPDGVAYPEGGDQVADLLRLAARRGYHVIPYGGGTSVVGHINPPAGDAPVLTLDLSRMNRLLDLDDASRLARFQAGVTGPELERQLERHGYCLGHFPQSWEYSTLGGWIATRSTGQQSYLYGRIEDLFIGGLLETPEGTLSLPSLPASAAGPDLRQMVLGSEGRLGVITEASVRIQPLPQVERFYGVFFSHWQAGVEAARSLAQRGVPVSMIRLSDAHETRTTLALAGKPRLIGVGDGLLRMLGKGDSRCLMVLGITANRARFAEIRATAIGIVRSHGGLNTGAFIGDQWRRSRFKSPYLRNTLWEQGYALDTLETAIPWAGVPELRDSLLAALDRVYHERGIRLLRFSHLSHLYPAGASIYITFLYPRQQNAEETLEVWRAAKQAASEVIVAQQGTISHQHGVGLDHAPYLQAEKGMLGIRALDALSRTLDPHHLMNPGKGWSDRVD